MLCPSWIIYQNSVPFMALGRTLKSYRHQENFWKMTNWRIASSPKELRQFAP
jgi:hypothetical protein